MSIHLLGEISRIDDPEQEVSTVTRLPGYHVNSTKLIPSLSSMLVNPSNPVCVISGMTTHFYKFDNIEQAHRLLSPMGLWPEEPAS